MSLQGGVLTHCLVTGTMVHGTSFSRAEDDQGVEGVAIKKNPGEKVMKVGKKVAANKIRSVQHEDKDSMNSAHEDASRDLVVQAQTQARAVPTPSSFPSCLLNKPFMQ